MAALTPASPADLPPLGELIADAPFWRYPAGAAREGLAHLRVWLTAGPESGHMAVVTETGLAASVTESAGRIWAELADRYGRSLVLLEHHLAPEFSEGMETLDLVRAGADGEPHWSRVWPTPEDNPRHAGLELWMAVHGHQIVSRPASAFDWQDKGLLMRLISGCNDPVIVTSCAVRDTIEPRLPLSANRLHPRHVSREGEFRWGDLRGLCLACLTALPAAPGQRRERRRLASGRLQVLRLPADPERPPQPSGHLSPEGPAGYEERRQPPRLPLSSEIPRLELPLQPLRPVPQQEVRQRRPDRLRLRLPRRHPGHRGAGSAIGALIGWARHLTVGGLATLGVCAGALVVIAVVIRVSSPRRVRPPKGRLHVEATPQPPPFSSSLPIEPQPVPLEY